MALFDLFSEHRGAPDCLDLMQQDHIVFKDLLERLSKTTARGASVRTRLFTTLKQKLVAHEFMEEQVIYKALRASSETKQIVLESLQEHHTADLLVKELAKLSPGSEEWGPKCHVLGEGIKHHIHEEEHKLFVEARSLFDEEQRRSFGADMARKRQQKLDQQHQRSQHLHGPGRTTRATSDRSSRPSRRKLKTHRSGR